MKRLLVIGVLLAILVGALSSHGKNSTHTTAANEPLTPTTPAVAQPAHHAARVRYTKCDQNISAGPHTTCGFADNVFRAFARQVSNEGSEPADYAVQATSPATGKTYRMSCRTTNETTECSGGKGAHVEFPLNAAQIYYQPPAPKTETPPSHEAPESEGEEAEETEPEEPSGGGSSEEDEVGSSSHATDAQFCSEHECIGSFETEGGTIVECSDGTYSHAGGISGACSHHGGEN